MNNAMFINRALSADYSNLGGAFSQERLALAGQMTLLGMVMIFAVLGLLWGVLAIFQRIMAGNTEKPAEAPKKKNNLGNIAMVAMFIGLCIAYLSFYLAGFILKPAQYLPLAVTIIAAAIMYLFTALAKKPKLRWLENFDIALSMLLAMAAAVVINLVF